MKDSSLQFQLSEAPYSHCCVSFLYEAAACVICNFYLTPRMGSLSFAFYCTPLPLYDGSGPFHEPFNLLTKKKCFPWLVQKLDCLRRNLKGMTASTRWAAEYTALSRECQKRQRGFFLKGGDLPGIDWLVKSQPHPHRTVYPDSLCSLKGKTGILSCQLLTDIQVSLITNKHSLSGHESSYLYIISSNPSFCKDGKFWRRNKEKKLFIM